MTQQNALQDDEISISDIITKLWRRRGLIVVLPLLSALIGMVAVLVMASQARTPAIHYVSLTGIEKGNYPNGVAFSPQDLKAPEVLAEVSRRMGVEGGEDFAEAVTVSYGAPTTTGILKKYSERLSQKGLNAAEIDAINAGLDEELQQATQKTAVISVDFQSLGLGFDQGAQLAVMLPTVWADVFTTQFRVLDNTQLSGASMIEALSLTSSIGVIEADSYVVDMLSSLVILEEDSRLSGLQTDTGVTPSDLRVQIDNFYNLYLSTVLSNNLSRDDALTRFYQLDLSLRVDKILEQIAGIDDAIDSIQTVIGRDQGGVAAGQGYGTDRMQITGDAFGGIVDLVNKSSLAEYLTSLYEKKGALIDERSELNLKLSKIRKAVGFEDNFLTVAEARLNVLNAQYIELLVKAREMNRRNNATLSRALGSPHKAGSRFPKNSILLIILSVLMGGFVAAVAALVLPSRSAQ
jgi:hypothetical protein